MDCLAICWPFKIVCDWLFVELALEFAPLLAVDITDSRVARRARIKNKINNDTRNRPQMVTKAEVIINIGDSGELTCNFTVADWWPRSF